MQNRPAREEVKLFVGKGWRKKSFRTSVVQASSRSQAAAPNFNQAHEAKAAVWCWYNGKHDNIAGCGKRTKAFQKCLRQCVP